MYSRPPLDLGANHRHWSVPEVRGFDLRKLREHPKRLGRVERDESYWVQIPEFEWKKPLGLDFRYHYCYEDMRSFNVIKVNDINTYTGSCTCT
jgi:hypothetical protein